MWEVLAYKLCKGYTDQRNQRHSHATSVKCLWSSRTRGMKTGWPGEIFSTGSRKLLPEGLWVKWKAEREAAGTGTLQHSRWTKFKDKRQHPRPRIIYKSSINLIELPILSNKPSVRTQYTVRQKIKEMGVDLIYFYGNQWLRLKKNNFSPFSNHAFVWSERFKTPANLNSKSITSNSLYTPTSSATQRLWERSYFRR